ncbi:MAG: hypothetical protein JWM73_369, partial [Solirubrobacterales bacterium]|nr:hypothetical protein [Solirubrobacterales bacterium]
GPAGQDGAPGAIGATGPAGATGAAGTPGTNGTNGTNGTDGASTGETLYAESLGAGSNFGTSCGAPSGPSITFTAVTGTYVQMMAQADLQRSTASADAVCLIVDGSSAGTILSSTSLAYETKAMADTIVLPLAAGSHTISLAYTGTGGTANFRNRRLWVTVFHPAG